MSVSFENKETNHGVLTFTISQEQIKPALDRVFESVKKTLNVPGFRKGHIPRPIFNQRFGEEALYQDAPFSMRLGRLDSQRYFRAASSSSRIFMP